MSKESASFPWSVHQATLANGLRVVVCPDTTAPITAVNLWYDVGSRHEPAGKTGFAHLFEHLMFEGSAHVAKGEHMATVNNIGGGAMNATTSPDRTNYFQTVPAGQLEVALWLEADRMAGLNLTQENLDNQRDIVKNERRQNYENPPYGDWSPRAFALLFPEGHPYHHTTIGSMEDLSAAALEDFQVFRNTYYSPNNAVLTVVGDVSADEVVALAEKYFGGIEPVADIPAAPSGAVPERIGAEVRQTVHDPKVPAERLFVIQRAPAWTDPRWAAHEVLSVALGSGRGSRMYKALVTDLQLAQSSESFTSTWELNHGASVMFGTLVPRDGVSVDALADAYRAVLDDASKTALTDTELDRAKAQLTSGWHRGVAAYSGRADKLSMHLTVLGSTDRLHTYLDELAAVTAEDVRAVAEAYLHPDNRITLTYLPTEEPTDALTDES